MAAVTVDTSNYEFTHGRKPRGYGAWAFQQFEDMDCMDKRIIWVYGSTFSDARRVAVAEAKKRGLDTLYVAT
jgi:hypothetical protein